MTPTTPAAAPLSPMLSVRPFPNDERPYRGALIIRMSGVRAPSRLKLLHAPNAHDRESTTPVPAQMRRLVTGGHGGAAGGTCHDVTIDGGLLRTVTSSMNTRSPVYVMLLMLVDGALILLIEVIILLISLFPLTHLATSTNLHTSSLHPPCSLNTTYLTLAARPLPPHPISRIPKTTTCSSKRPHEQYTRNHQI